MINFRQASRHLTTRDKAVRILTLDHYLTWGFGAIAGYGLEGIATGNYVAGGIAFGLAAAGASFSLMKNRQRIAELHAKPGLGSR